MKKQDNSERRRFQRCAAQLPLNVSGADIALTTDTKNISGSGLFCQVEQFIPVMTKLSIVLRVPLLENRRKKEKTVECTGVVVRITPETPRPAVRQYNLGVFFTDIAEADRQLLAGYVEQAFCAGRN